MSLDELDVLLYIIFIYFHGHFHHFLYFLNVHSTAVRSFNAILLIFRFLIRRKERYRILHFEEGEKIWSARHAHKSEYIFLLFNEAKEEHIQECEACQYHCELMQRADSKTERRGRMEK